MKKTWKRILPVILLLTLCFSLTAQAALPDLGQNQVSGWPQGPELWAECGLVMDVKTGTVLYSKNGDEALYPASITKLMTALLTLENVPLTDVVTFSSQAVYSIEADSAHIAVSPGEELTVEQCLYALLLQSANEVANGLAEHVAGSMSAFADMMNERAESLGCINTHFVNANGLHDENHYTCGYDMALIMKELIKNETFLAICSADSYQIPPTNLQPDTRYLYQKHRMLLEGSGYTYEGTVCGKTGFTDEALNTLVTYARRGDMELIAVSMNSNWHHYDDTITLFDYGFQNFTIYNMADAANPQAISDDMLSESRELFDTSSATLTLDSAGSWLVLPNTAALSDVESSLTMDENPEDDIAATVTYRLQGTALGYGILKIEVPESAPFDFSAHETASPAPLPAPTSGGKLIINVWMLAGGAAALLVLFILIVLIAKARRKRASIIRVKNSRREARRRMRESEKRKKRQSGSSDRRY